VAAGVALGGGWLALGGGWLALGGGGLAHPASATATMDRPARSDRT
jgi:hypothetical protein